MPNEPSNILTGNSILERDESKITDYSEILLNHRLEFKFTGYHLQVGEIEQVQGWILHISIVRSQIPEVLNCIIPILKDVNVPFKLVKDKETAKNILDGNLGDAEIGKILSIYPASNREAIELARILIIKTSPFKGPAILTDIHLGGLLYTRYGALNPIIMTDLSGNEVKLIHDQYGALIKDECTIPFALVPNIDWPFSDFASPIPPKENKLIRHIYKPIKNLKVDPRGNVIKALYLKRLFHVKWCVIKQGIKNMWSDDFGRDIPDRLFWQQELHNKLASSLALPKILDIFTEGQSTYLVMEFCKGKSLYNLAIGLNRNSKVWHTWPLANQLIILEYVLQIMDILSTLHKKGYIHRDVTPVNFLVNEKQQLVPIDLELAYCLSTQSPDPPFMLGTNGFMSPEQEAMQKPTIKDDIYGLGATIINLVSGLTPTIFNNEDKEQLHPKINFFIRDTAFASTLASCLDEDPSKRPDIRDVKNELVLYKSALKNRKSSASIPLSDCKQSDDILHEIINCSIRGLVLPPILMTDGVWVSPTDDNTGKQNKEFILSGGLHHGASGVLYLLGRAKQVGYDITPCITSCEKAWKYIVNNYLRDLPNIAPGLYGGASGIALALITAMNAKILENTEVNRQYLEQCLKLPNTAPELSNGVAGQGIVALQSKNYVEIDVISSITNNHVTKLLDKLAKKEYWVWHEDKYGRRRNANHFSYGNSGIIWFLLEYTLQFKNSNAKEKVRKLINNLCQEETLNLNQIIKRNGFLKAYKNQSVWDITQGIILVCIKAYEVWNDPLYKNLAEDILALFPDFPVDDNVTQEFGLSGLGELYLEAYRVFKNKKWQSRSDWIAALLAHTCRRESDVCYWLNNNSTFSTADFLVGNSGIIHFLLRYLSPDKIGYRLLT